MKTGKSLRAIATKRMKSGLIHTSSSFDFPCVKTGKSLRAIATEKEADNSVSSLKGCVKTGKSLRAIAEIWE